MSYEDKRYDDSSLCCIAGCHHTGTRADANGRRFCDDHWQEEICSVPGCGLGGMVFDQSTGRSFCTNHAWKLNCPEDPEPLVEITNPQLGMGAGIEAIRLPEVSDTVREECLRELDEGKLNKWRLKK